MEGPVADLLEGDVYQTRMQVRPMGRAIRVISARWSDVLDPAGIEDDRWLTLVLPQDQVPAVIAELVRANVQVYQVIHKRQSLEDLFIAVTDHHVGGDDD
jgi:hypothetical protein